MGNSIKREVVSNKMKNQKVEYKEQIIRDQRNEFGQPTPTQRNQKQHVPRDTSRGERNQE